MEKYYRFAGVELCVDIPKEQMYEDERNLSAFAVESAKDPHRFEFRITEHLAPPEGHCIARDGGYLVYADGERSVRYIGSVQSSWENAYIRVEHCGKNHKVELKASEFTNRVGVHTVLSAMGAEYLIAKAGGFVFHCSYIERNGRAILFTAPSGTGKSTQAELWRQHRGTEIINGDRAAIRFFDGEFLAEGIPFAGSSEYCKNRSLPIEAIVYLEQAPKTSIRRCKGREAFLKIWEGISANTWDKKSMELVSDAAIRAAEAVPVFNLACTPDESAVIALENELGKQV